MSAEPVQGATNSETKNDTVVSESSQSVGTDDNQQQNAESTSPRPKLEGEALKEAIKKQIDWYFSKDNLATDRFLLSQMNQEMFVPIKIIAEFKMLKNMTTDFDYLVAVMKECKSVIVDENTMMVKPNMKAYRNTIILRDIPSTTPESEVRAVFSDPSCGTIQEIRSDIGDCWYVTFENDDVALSTLEHIKTQQFKGQPIKARIKTEVLFRNWFAQNSVTNPQAPAPTIPLNAYNDPSLWRNMQYYPVYDGQNPNYGNRRGYRRGGNASRGNYGGRSRSNSGNRRGDGKDQGRRRRGSQGEKVLELGAAEFPPLPNQGERKSGYEGEFKAYSKQQMVDIITAMREVTKPAGMKEYSAVVLSQPNVDHLITKPFPKKLTAAEIAKKASHIPVKAEHKPKHKDKAQKQSKQEKNQSNSKEATGKDTKAKAKENVAKDDSGSKDNKDNETAKDNTTAPDAVDSAAKEGAGSVPKETAEPEASPASPSPSTNNTDSK